MTNALPAPMCPEPSEGAAPRYTGAILGLLDDVLQGWAADTSTPDGAPVIEVFIDGASVALARADQYEPNAVAPHQFCGFTVQLHREWLDSASAISVGVANTTVMLSGLIKLPISTPTEAAAVASQLWHTGGLRVAGWSWDPQDPTRHVTLRVKEGDELVCEVVCNEPHQALAYRDTCDHGFTIDLPWTLADGTVHVLTVEDDQGRPVAGSPIRLCCVPEGMEGVVETLSVEHDAAKVALLKVLAQDASHRLPKSAGWQYYPDWYEAFQGPDKNPRPVLTYRIGVLVLTGTSTTADDETATIASVGNFPAGLIHIEKTGHSDIAPALERLLGLGCAGVLPIQAGDRFAPEAVYHLGALLEDGSEWGFADCDQDDIEGGRSNPWFKPVWDIDYFIGADIFSPGAIFGAALIEQVLASRDEDVPSGDLHWDTFLARIAWVTELNEIPVAHLPRVLYHRNYDRCSNPELQAVSATRLEAIGWLCNRLVPGARVERLDEFPGLFRATWPLPTELPKVSLIIPTRNQYKLLSACIEGLLNNTDYPNLEIIIMDNQSEDPETLSYLKHVATRGVKVIAHPYPFNYSSINNDAVRHSAGEIIGLINNDVEILNPDWLKNMLSQLVRQGVGVVGAKLLWPNRMVQHGGVVFGVNCLAAHTGNRLSEGDAGYLATNLLTRAQSAVTAACLLIRKDLYEKLQGLSEQEYPVAFNDVDLCLRVRDCGLRVVWDASAKLIHAESASRGKDVSNEKRNRAQREQQNFMNRWSKKGTDPYYHPALSLDYLTGPYGGLSIPPHDLNARYGLKARS